MKTLLRTLVVATTLLAAAAAWAGNTSKVLHYFGLGNDGWAPESGLVFDGNGNLYGTTPAGGTGCDTPGCGIVFQLQPNADGTWMENIIHNFSGSDGALSHASVVFDGRGTLYGTTSVSGTANQGTVFALMPNARGNWSALVLHAFTGAWDGGNPYGSLLLDSSGHIYGMTSAGGTNNDGVVFSLSGQTVGTEIVLHSFTGGVEGSGPTSTLVSDAAGNLYGTSYSGGPNNAGTVFKLTRNQHSPGWNQSVLYSFQAAPGSGNDGANPYAGLAFGPDGNLYGTTFAGGPTNDGTVFRLAANPDGTWTESVLYAFRGYQDGWGPYGGVTFDRAGNLYGTTVGGGGGRSGTVYKLTPSSAGGWTETILHAFTGHGDGGLPGAGVVLDNAGNIYGTAAMGGKGGFENGGVVFEITP